MRLRTIGLAAALSASIVGTSGAVVAPRNHEDRVVNANESRAPRTHREVRWSRQNQLAGLPGWMGMLDSETGIPVRMWGPGVTAPGAMQDPAVAESAARSFISQHLALLAPGGTMADFTLVANQLSPEGDVRSVGFEQRIGGVRVLGGTISVSFKNDRVVIAGSTALPNVTVSSTPRAIDLPALEAAARAWLALDGHDVTVRSVPVERVIVPSVRPRAAGGITYRIADQLSVQAQRLSDGRWTVWMDAATGAPIARTNELMYASVGLLDAPDRSPSYGARSGKVVGNVAHMVNNVSTMASADGVLTWAAGAVSVTPHLTGTYVKVTTELGSALSDSLALSDGADVTWSHATEEFADAQISSFVFASQAKAYAKSHYNENLAWFDDQLEVSVNEDDTCNAFSTGDDIHFFKAKSGTGTTGTTGLSCQNTGRIADVVYHEFGHSIHNQSVIDGVGQFDGHMSEGAADMNAAFMTQDHGMGRGFFFTQDALRDLDPVDVEKRYPENWTGEVHDDGEIIGETYWDMRKALIAKLGDTAGDAQARKIYYGTLQRSVDMFTTYAEALVSDDDDGDLSNGTPNYCEIYSAWALHGLADPRTTLNLTNPVRDGFNVSFTAGAPLQAACPAPSIASAKLSWRKSGGTFAAIDLASTDATTWAAAMPTQDDGSIVQYKIVVTTSDGGKITYPENAGIPYYEFYVGDVDPIWCANFEDGGPDWTHSANRPDRDEWEVGPPMGLGGDPRTAHGGNNVLGIDLDKDGTYRGNTSTWAESPVIDLQGHTNVHLQYYRWLGVEDSAYDEASIFANDEQVWTNSTSVAGQDDAGTPSVDHEWAFHDVDLTAQATTGSIKLKFWLSSDQGLSFGGWNVDDVCIVAARAPEDCAATDTCVEDPTVMDNGCCSVGAKPYSGIALSIAALGLVLRRRRRR